MAVCGHFEGADADIELVGAHWHDALVFDVVLQEQYGSCAEGMNVDKVICPCCKLFIKVLRSGRAVEKMCGESGNGHRALKTVSPECGLQCF